MSRPARLLFLNPDPRATAGCNISMLRLLAGLDRARFSPVVAAPGDCGYREALARLDIPLHDYAANNWWFPDKQHFYRHLAGLRRRVESLTELIGKARIDLVYTNAEYAFEGGLAAAWSGKPHVWAQRVRFTSELDVLAHFPLSPQALYELMDDLSDRIVPNSRDGLDSFPGAAASDKFTVIESGVPPLQPRLTQADARAALRRRIGAAPDSRLVLAVGRVSPEKDLHTWLRAAAAVLASRPGPDTIFVHAGDITVPRYFEELEARARQPDLAGRIHFIGALPPADMPDLYQAADVFTLTSTRFEGFPRVCGEAIQAGLPVVATRCGGVEDYVADGKSGFLCEVGDHRALADRITALLQDAAAAARIGTQARRDFQARYDESQLNAKWNVLFGALIDHPPPPRSRLKYETTVNVLTHLGEIGLASTQPVVKPSLWKLPLRFLRSRLALKRNRPRGA